MMELNKEQIEKKEDYFIRLKGRIAEVDSPYWTRLAKGTRMQIMSYLPDKGIFKVLAINGNDYEYCLRDEFNLVDKEFSGHSIVKKGIRTERKDKFGDKFMLELQNNKRDIYLSVALSSLLNLNQEENYVGFATDPDTGIMYIFAADKVSGYEFDKSNNRITSTADWREMQKVYETMNFEVGTRPIVDNNNPGFVFYTVTPNYQYFKEESSQQKNTKIKKVELGESIKVNYGTTIKVQSSEKKGKNPYSFDEDAELEDLSTGVFRTGNEGLINQLQENDAIKVDTQWTPTWYDTNYTSSLQKRVEELKNEKLKEETKSRLYK